MSSSDRQITNSECIVIGGGITGLTIATILQRKGIKVTVLDKGKGIGGRVATRRLRHEDSVVGVFDYGTQYFSVGNPQFQVWVDDWLKHDVIKEWSQGFGQADETCYCGVKGTRGIAQYLAEDLDVQTGTKAIEVSYDKKWLVKTEDDDHQYQGDMLVMTSPMPQSLSLLDASLMALPLDIRFALEKIEYDKCITVLALLEQPSSIPAPGGISLEHDSLAWLADNHQKEISPDGYAITLQATPKFSDEYWSSDDAEIVYKLVTAGADYLDSPVIKYQVHRWRYSQPRTFYSESCLILSELPLVMAGDAFVAPSIEGAVISGMAAGKFICQRFRGNG